MTDLEEQPSLLDAVSESVSNFDRLAAALPAEGLAAKLLEAWRSADADTRTERMLAVAQPPHPQLADDTNASVD